MKGLLFSVLCFACFWRRKIPLTEGEWVQTVIILYIPHYQNWRDKKWLQVAVILWSYCYSFLPINHLKWCTMSESHSHYYWSWDTFSYFALVGARWHIFTFEVTVGDNEVGGPFQPHIVSLITVCQLLDDCACQPTNLEWCKAPWSLGKYHCLWQVMQETAMQRSCQGTGLL